MSDDIAIPISTKEMRRLQRKRVAAVALPGSSSGNNGSDVRGGKDSIAFVEINDSHAGGPLPSPKKSRKGKLPLNRIVHLNSSSKHLNISNLGVPSRTSNSLEEGSGSDHRRRRSPPSSGHRHHRPNRRGSGGG